MITNNVQRIMDAVESGSEYINVVGLEEPEIEILSQWLHDNGYTCDLVDSVIH